jgi:hypothetical protein
MPLHNLSLLLLLMTVACYSGRSVGARAGSDEPQPSATPKFPSKIVGEVGESLSLESPRAGDMDGDGLDDFVVLGTLISEGGSARTLLYLFYGRTEFPAELSTADADAAFEVDQGFNGTVGDLNGDGFSDLLLTHTNSADFAFGSKERRHGIIARKSDRVSWTVGALPPPFSPELLVELSVRGVGDLNGDGLADLIVNAYASLDAGSAGGAWVVLGHPGEWQSDAWDASHATADLGLGTSGPKFDDAASPPVIWAEHAGDIDGDGRADLIALSGDGSLVFYGKREYPAHLSAAEADAKLLPRAAADAAANAPDSEPIVEEPLLAAQPLGDLDADGNDDLLVAGFAIGSQITYGRRWSGDQQIEPELAISPEQPADQYVVSAAAGDLDGDGSPELLVSVIGGISPENASSSPAGLAYVLRGTGERLRGNITLSDSDRWTPPIAALAAGGAAARSIFSPQLAGDIDGDGTQDILTSSVVDDLTGASVVYLLPSTHRARDEIMTRK